MHGAPCRLRCESELEFELIEAIVAIEVDHVLPISTPVGAGIVRIAGSMALACSFARTRCDIASLAGNLSGAQGLSKGQDWRECGR